MRDKTSRTGDEGKDRFVFHESCIFRVVSVWGRPLGLPGDYSGGVASKDVGRSELLVLLNPVRFFFFKRVSNGFSGLDMVTLMAMPFFSLPAIMNQTGITTARQVFRMCLSDIAGGLAMPILWQYLFSA